MGLVVASLDDKNFMPKCCQSRSQRPPASTRSNNYIVILSGRVGRIYDGAGSWIGHFESGKLESRKQGDRKYSRHNFGAQPKGGNKKR